MSSNDPRRKNRNQTSADLWPDRIIKDPANFTTEERQTIGLTACAVLDSAIDGDRVRRALLTPQSPWDLAAVVGKMTDMTLAVIRSTYGFGSEQEHLIVEQFRQVMLRGQGL
jgi:hypothetical protein